MNILMVAPYFPPQLSPEAIVNGKFASALVSAGYSLTVVTAEPTGNLNLNDSILWNEMGTVIQMKDPFRIYGDRASRFIARVKMRRDLVGWFTVEARKSCNALLKQQKYDLVITRSGPVDSLFVGFFLKKKFGVNWAATINDPLPNCLYPPPYSQGIPITIREKIQLRIVQSILSQPDILIFPSSRLAKYMATKLKIEIQGKVLVLPHIGWSCKDTLNDKISRPKQERIEILHIGSVGSARVSLSLLELLGAVAKDGSRAVGLTFVGPVASEIKKHVIRSYMDTVIKFERQVGYLESLRRMQQADILLLIEAEMEEGIFLPSKFCDYIASGKPTLMYSPINGTVSDIVGGTEHPGFLGQDDERCASVLKKFISRFQKTDSNNTFGTIEYPLINGCHSTNELRNAVNRL